MLGACHSVWVLFFIRDLDGLNLRSESKSTRPFSWKERKYTHVVQGDDFVTVAISGKAAGHFVGKQVLTGRDTAPSEVQKGSEMYSWSSQACCLPVPK